MALGCACNKVAPTPLARRENFSITLQASYSSNAAGEFPALVVSVTNISNYSVQFPDVPGFFDGELVIRTGEKVFVLQEAMAFYSSVTMNIFPTWAVIAPGHHVSFKLPSASEFMTFEDFAGEAYTNTVAEIRPRLRNWFTDITKSDQYDLYCILHQLDLRSNVLTIEKPGNLKKSRQR